MTIAPRPPVVPSVQRFRLSRRSFLRGAGAIGGATVWLPPLEAMFNVNGTAHADGTRLAKRFVEFFWGVSYSTVGGSRTWAPLAGSGPLPATLPYHFNTDAKYQAKLRALAQAGTFGLKPEHLTPSLSDPGIRKYVRIIDGLSTAHLVKEANQHFVALLGVVTLPKASFQYSQADSRPQGPSLDRFIGSFAPFRGGTVPHMHLGVVPVRNYGGVATDKDPHKTSIGLAGMKDGKWSASAAVLREEANWDPLQVFDQMFGGIAGGSESGGDRRARSVLDGVLRVSQGTLSRLSGADRQIVDAHLDAVRQIEKNLTGAATCSKPTPPATAKTMVAGRLDFEETNANRTAPRVAKDMRDLAALMLKCDYTRALVYVITPTISGFNGEHFLDFSSATGPRQVKSLHRDSHDAKPYHRLTTPWHMGQLAALIEVLAAIPEGAGSAMDNTLVWATSEHGPQLHSLEDIATIVAGGPTLVGGNYYQSPGRRPISDLHLGILSALDLPHEDYLGWVKPPDPRPLDLRSGG